MTSFLNVFISSQKFETRIDYNSTSHETGSFDLAFRQLEEKESFGYSVTGFEVVMARVATPFLVNTHLPSGLLTIISFIGFFIPVDKVTLCRFQDKIQMLVHGNYFEGTWKNGTLSNYIPDVSEHQHK